jgi:Fe2+-dicitrate sensor, membrane component
MSQHRFWNLLGKKLANDASEDELFELEKLMRVHPELLYAAQHIEDLWKMRDLDKTDESEEAFIAHFRKIRNIWPVPVEGVESSPTNQRSTRWYFFKTKHIAIFAISLTVILSTILWLNKKETQSRGKTEYSEISTKPGSRSKLVLPDGSVVWLNAGSKITYGSSFGTLNRNIQLTGEAFFDVKKSTIPFIIHTGNVQIKVLGTAFNVKAYPTEQSIITSLIRGRVEVSMDKRPETKIILNPNEKLVLMNETSEHASQDKIVTDPIVAIRPLTHTKDSIILETSWKDNKLIFENEAFEDLAREMERWFGVSITFANQDLKKARFTGVFEKETIEEAFDALQISTEFHYQSKNNSIIIQ